MDSSRLKKLHSQGSGIGFVYALSAMQGFRYEMEDAHCENPQVNDLDGWSFFAVFDGHGGDFCSNTAKELLNQEISQQLKNKLKESTKPQSDFERGEISDKDLITLINSSFDAVDKALLGSDKVKIEEDRSGTTVVACLLTPKKIFLINCGDSRAILVRNNRVELSTFDHKPSQLRERRRIHNAGGLVALSRVNGGLATSRGLGDSEYKTVKSLEAHQQFVTSKPDIYSIAKDENGDQFIILACDGIWDVMSNEEVRAYMENNLRNEIVDCDVLLRVNDQLLDDCLKKGSRDNMSLLTIYFTQQRPKTANSQKN